MSVPDHSAIVDELFATGHYHLKTHEGLAAFVDACVIALHSHDSRWGHLKKKPGQTQIHGHAEDAALYKKPDGTAQAVDFVSGAGGTNPQPGWHVDTFVYKHADWLDPDDHDGAPPIPPPATQHPIPPRDEALDEQKWLHAYYKAQEGLQRPKGLWRDDTVPPGPDFEGIAAWYLDVYQNERMKGKSRADARAAYVSAIRHSTEWQAKHPGEQP